MTGEPRLMSRAEAAAYCGISPTSFSCWVSSHKMPPAIPGTRKWDKRAIDAKLDEISGLAGDEDAFDRWERLHPPETDLQRWKRERDKKRSGKA